MIIMYLLLSVVAAGLYEVVEKPGRRVVLAVGALIQRRTHMFAGH